MVKKYKENEEPFLSAWKIIIVTVNWFRNQTLKRVLTHNSSSSAKTRFELEFHSLECANTLWNSDIVIDDLIHER